MNAASPAAAAAAADPAPLLRRWRWLDGVALGFVVAVVLSTPALRGSGRELDHWGNFTRFLGRFFPPDLSVLPVAGVALVETFRIAVLATFFALFLAVPLGLAGARTLSPRPVTWLARAVLNAVRTLPSLVWALLAVAIVGANPRAGVIALTFYSLGYLGKFFADAFESVDLRAARALRLGGAHAVQAFQYAVWPAVRPLLWSHALWMLEYNTRSAAIIGYVGAGGLGVLLHSYQEFYAWDKFAAVLLLIFALVCALDALGGWIRAKIRPAARTE